MFTIIGLSLHSLLAEFYLVDPSMFWIPILIGMIWDVLFVFTCVKVLIKE